MRLGVLAWFSATLACTPASIVLPLPDSAGGSGDGSAGPDSDSDGDGDGPGGCAIDRALWIDNVAGDNANPGTEASPLADLDAALAAGGTCTVIHVVATDEGYSGACIQRDAVAIVGVGGRPHFDAPVVCDDRLAGLFVRADDVRLEHLTVDVSGAPGVLARAVVFSGVPDAPIRGGLALDLEAIGPGPADDGRALVSASLCFDCAVQRSVVRGAEGAGIGFDNHQDDAAILDNAVDGAGGGCIVVNGEPSEAIAGDAVIDGVSSRVSVERNIVRDCGAQTPSIHLASAVDGTVVDNVIGASEPGGILLDDDGLGDGAFGSRDTLLAHNTIDCSACTDPAVRILAGSTGVRMVDTIVTGLGAAVLLDASTHDSVAIDHDAYAPGMTFVDAGDTLGFTLWQARGFDGGSIPAAAADLFVDLDGGDVHLRDGAPAIDAGVDAGVALDADGAPRWQGAAPDLGAYERAP